MNIISPNMLKTFEQCEQKFYFRYIKRLSIPQKTISFQKGKNIHALANYFLNGEDISKMLQVLTVDEMKTWENLKSNKFLKLKCVETEYNLSCKVGTYWVGGRLDALMVDGTSNFVILDYKTGGVPQNPETDYQTMVYLLAANKFLIDKNKDKNKTLKFVYIDLKNNQEREVLLTESLISEYEKKIISACKSIDFAGMSDVYSAKGDCKNCEYKKVCQKGF